MKVNLMCIDGYIVNVFERRFKVCILRICVFWFLFFLVMKVIRTRKLTMILVIVGDVLNFFFLF